MSSPKILQDDLAAVGFAKRLEQAIGHQEKGGIARKAGIAASTLTKYLAGGSEPGAFKAACLADALGVNIAWLLTGTGTKERLSDATAGPGAALFDASEVDWVFLPHYRFDSAIDAIVPRVTETFPFRRDWLKRLLGVERGLWVTEMPTDSLPAVAEQGDTIICRNAAVMETGRAYIIALDGQLVVRRVIPGPEMPGAAEAGSSITVDQVVQRGASLIGVILARVAVRQVTPKNVVG
ncbi:MAG TPA: helix-turn-helix transcriptional regulator [Caulobacteraceae bacterium]|nr:helix-turn-helix transcriptional regulator [Caulobacteraceae bacterium]